MYLTALHNRSVISLFGADRALFLQGLLSQDINLCAPGKAIHAALLTPQGKFLHEMFVFQHGDAYLIDCEAGRAEDLLERLKRYKLRAKVEFANLHAEYKICALYNNDLEPPLEWPRLPENYISSADPRHTALGFRIITPSTNQPTQALTEYDAYDQHRLKLGMPDGSHDMLVDKSTLIEGNYDLLNGISWSKGCYVGQEVTARMHYRGLAKKRLFPVMIEGPPPAPGIILHHEDAEVGEMRSHSGPYGLALLNIEKAHVLMHKDKPITQDG
ncbi:MAG: folate-binding protein YgfZ, partial [Alphaproteobacteria bacterium]|nr:folate-binding protein YgfZ [Alphaproteobacteria bacterium]